MPAFLDNNATTPIDERVLDTMLPYLRDQFGNPSSRYQVGRQSRSAIEQAREQVASLVNVHPSQVIFTSGGTEANNMAIIGAAACMPPGLLAISDVEHHSVSAVARSMKNSGWSVTEIAVDETGKISNSSLSSFASQSPNLASVMMANNETGVVNDIALIAEYANQCGAILHTDAVQAVGKMPVDFKATGAHMMSISAHKLYGPKGAGALIVDKAIDTRPLLYGGGQEKGRRAGTENVAAITGFGKAAELAQSELDQRHTHMKELQKELEYRLNTEIAKISIFGQAAVRLPNTTFFAIPNIDSETLLMMLDQDGFAVSSGSACGSDEVEPSRVLQAMGVENKLARGAVRISVGKDTTKNDIGSFVECLKEKISALQNYGAVA